MKLLKGLVVPGLFLLLSVCCKPLQAQSVNQDASLAEDSAQPDGDVFIVTIADPFIEMHTGPAAGYPIFHVVDRGDEVRILRRKTDWYKIETADGKLGWANRDQMRRTLLPSGETFNIIEVDVDDFTQRKWVVGVTGGELASAPVFTLFGAYAFTENLSAETHFGQSIGRVSSSTFIKTNLVMQPLPELTYSPYMTLGLGKIKVSRSTTLISTPNETNTLAQFGFGIQRYISRSFLFRFEANEYVIFSAASTSNENEEVSEWKFGFAVFF